MSNTFYNKDAKIWHGTMVEPKYNHQDSIGSVILKCMLDNPEHISQICYESGKELTNGDLAKLSIQAAKHFQKLNLEPGDLIAMCVENSDNVAPLFFGAMLAGLCVYALNPRFNKEGIQRICGLAKPRLMICDGDIYLKVRQALEESDLCSTPIYTERLQRDGVQSTLEFFEETTTNIRSTIDDFKVPTLEKGSDQVAAIVCTSGSTGSPKGVSISHAALLNSYAVNAIPIDPNASKITTFCIRALYSINGLLMLVQGTLGGTTRIISEKPFCVETFLEIVKRYKVNFLTSFPQYLSLALASDKIVDSDLSSIRICALGGCAVLYSLVEKLKKFIPNAIFVSAYNSSETCCVVSTGVCEPTNSMGELKPNIEVKIIDDHGNLLGPNSTGEICIRTKFHWAGYLNDPEATRTVYDEHRWYHSNDLGYFNDNGQLYMVDRKSDILKYGAFYFAPSNIEKVIKELPEIHDVCVVGFPDSTYGHLPTAAVVKQPGHVIEKSQIIEHVADRMQHFEQLHGGVYFFESLPQNLSGKIHRREVAELCEASGQFGF